MEKDIMAGCCKDFLSAKSKLQENRLRWQPILPRVFNSSLRPVPDTSVEPLGSDSESDVLKQLFPKTSEQNYLLLEPDVKNSGNTESKLSCLRVGVVLSGGQAAGGHNVIVGLFDYMKKLNSNSKLFGFLDGPQGIYLGNYVELTSDKVDQYRNQGGFDMICSGRHKIHTDQQKEDALKVCTSLSLDGVVIIGGDDSNTNAAILAEFFKQKGSSICVIGCPKTIDGDLKNKFVETSFGFDTAVKTYSDLIGNLSSHILSTQKGYMFIRLMGRSASNITLECALQTRPNLCFIGEEVSKDHRSLQSLVDEITDLIVKREKENKHFGIILLPEGLIEFIPEIGILIQEINDILARTEFQFEKLSENSQRVFRSIPESIQNQLLLDRDAHGNVQVSRIATESLLIMMVQNKMKAEKFSNSIPMKGYFFGYEGRCALPTLFDATYCYALGHTAGVLLTYKLTGYMAVVQKLHLPPQEWVAAGCPLQWMMTIEKRHGELVPVIKKYLVEVNKPLFGLFTSVREAWKWGDFYRHPGPIQYENSPNLTLNYTIVPPKYEDLLPSTKENISAQCNALKTFSGLSPLAKQRVVATISVPPILTNPKTKAIRNLCDTSQNTCDNRMIFEAFPIQSQQHGMCHYEVVASAKDTEEVEEVKSLIGPLRVGVVHIGNPVTGTSNVLHGLFQRLQLIQQTSTTCNVVSPCESFSLIGFKGSYGLVNQVYVELAQNDLALFQNYAGFETLGVSVEYDSCLHEAKQLEEVLKTCLNLKLTGLVFIGDHTAITSAAIIAEYLLEHQCSTSVVAVPASYENSLLQTGIEACVGYNSACKCYSSIVGNILTDAASAKKYWYIVRLMDHTTSFSVVDVAFETHLNLCIVGEKYSSKPQSFASIIEDITDAVVYRAEQKKNFGVLLFSDALFNQIPELAQLISDVNLFLKELTVEQFTQIKTYFKSKYGSNILNFSETSFFSKSSIQLLSYFPLFFHEELISNKKVIISELSIELLISSLVENELLKRKNMNRYTGTFTPISYIVGHQATVPMPSEFDCHVGLAYGYLSCIAIESRLTGYVCSISNIRSLPSSWKMSLIPFLRLENIRSQPYADLESRKTPVFGPSQIDLQGPTFMSLRHAEKEWMLTDRFCNPGPTQFTTTSNISYNQTFF